MDIIVKDFNEILETLNYSDFKPYIFKVKCLCASQTGWIDCLKPEVVGEDLVVGERHFPVKIIENIIVRGYIHGDKVEVCFKISNETLLECFNDDVKAQLKKFLHI